MPCNCDALPLAGKVNYVDRQTQMHAITMDAGDRRLICSGHFLTRDTVPAAAIMNGRGDGRGEAEAGSEVGMRHVPRHCSETARQDEKESPSVP